LTWAAAFTAVASPAAAPSSTTPGSFRTVVAGPLAAIVSIGARRLLAVAALRFYTR
jgi:hypothetical protein